jgi:glycosyltransferase involved in cell wall biosynthesis
MTVDVVSEERLERTPDGRVWGPSSYVFWRRYLDVFDRVRVVARLRDVSATDARKARADGPGVTFAGVPYYIGPTGYLARMFEVRRAVCAAFRPGDAVIIRLGSHLAPALEGKLRRLGAPYGVEVVGDPYEVFAPGVVDHALRPVFRWWFTKIQKRLCARACGAAYVTEQTLQRRYPCRPYAVGVSDVEVRPENTANISIATHYSSVELSAADFSQFRAPKTNGTLRLITVSSLAQLYKGTDVLIRAVARCLAEGSDISLTVVGDGKFRPKLEALCSSLGIQERVEFLGMLPGPTAVRQQLDQADLFVLPSRTEGLPRALIEAMARGLPCIASHVGGIPELLSAEDLVPPGHVGELAAKIMSLVTDLRRREAMSGVNRRRALDYRSEVLQERRIQFYKHIRQSTEMWIQQRVAMGRVDVGEQGYSDDGSSVSFGSWLGLNCTRTESAENAGGTCYSSPPSSGASHGPRGQRPHDVVSH